MWALGPFYVERDVSFVVAMQFKLFVKLVAAAGPALRRYARSTSFACLKLSVGPARSRVTLRKPLITFCACNWARFPHGHYSRALQFQTKFSEALANPKNMWVGTLRASCGAHTSCSRLVNSLPARPSTPKTARNASATAHRDLPPKL